LDALNRMAETLAQAKGFSVTIRAGFDVVVAPTYVTVLPCSPTVVATGGASYYRCGGSWYNQAYVNGSVTYVNVGPPPGY